MAAGSLDVDIVCLTVTLGGLGPDSSYSVPGYQRICAFAGELNALRGHLCN